MMKHFINELLNRRDLSVSEAYQAMSNIMGGKATDAQIAGFLMAMRMKGETVEEITGCARAMREAATHLDIGGIDAIDTCGTGGDTKGTFNVSTAAALVVSAAGVPVAKHGNRSVSSSSGSADVLQELGVNIEAPIETVEKSIKEIGLGFLFAPLLHKAMKYAIGPRRELGARTVFNLLGPLTNPAGVKRQIIGIYDKDLVEMIAGVLKNLGSTHAMVVHSNDGMDEISSFAPTNVAELRDGKIETYTLRPEEFGMDSGRIEDLQVQNAAESAESIKNLLNKESGPKLNMVLLNAGAAIYVGGRAQSIGEGVEQASDAIYGGAAGDKLKHLIELSQS